MPRGKGDRTIADVARIFAKLAEPVKRNSSPITAIATARAEALAALTRLDPIMDNLVWDNPPVKPAWNAVRRVEKAPAPKKLKHVFKCAGQKHARLSLSIDSFSSASTKRLERLG